MRVEVQRSILVIKMTSLAEILVKENGMKGQVNTYWVLQLPLLT
jgi:hypothetical protein